MTTSLHETLREHHVPGFMPMLLLGFVAVDARRSRWPTPKFWQRLSECTAGVLLVALLVFLVMAERALG